MPIDPDNLIQQGYEARREGRLDDAKLHFAAAIQESRSASDLNLLARALTGMGQIEHDLKNHMQAFEFYREAADIYRRLPDPLRVAHTVRHIGDILRNQNAIDESRICYEEALAIYRAHPETPTLDLANCIRGYAQLMTASGETVDAIPLWREAKILYNTAQVQAGEQECEKQIRKLTSI
jgi:tetratricopeptide (TPR) repeat protein